MAKMNSNSIFGNLAIGQKFIEVLTSCNEVAQRIPLTTHRGKSVNAHRVGGKLIFMADWEPVFIRDSDI